MVTKNVRKHAGIESDWELREVTPCLPCILEKRKEKYFRESVPCSLLKPLLLKDPLHQSWSGSWEIQLLLLTMLNPKSLNYHQPPTNTRRQEGWASETKGQVGPSPASGNTLPAQELAIGHVAATRHITRSRKSPPFLLSFIFSPSASHFQFPRYLFLGGLLM